MAPLRHSPKARVHRKPPHRVIIARGDRIRTFTVRPWLTGSALAVLLAITAGFAGATAYHLVFGDRDDLLAASIARQASMQRVYEERITALQTDLDRLTSHRLLDQRQVEARVDELAARQRELAERRDIMTGLADSAEAAGIPPAPAGPPSTPKPVIRSGALLLPSIVDEGHGRPGDASTWQPATDGMAALEAALDRMMRAQDAYLTQLAASVIDRNKELAATLASIGHSVPASGIGDVGGPYVPPAPGSDPERFRSGVSMIAGEIARYVAIRELAASLPLTLPVPDPHVTSAFGLRLDPFLGTPALHSGIDYRAHEGQPVAATAPGTVVAAETGYNSGYGNMVDIDHGNGIVTRFSHLSAVVVRVGQLVAKGAIIGRAGSTGRATGPHLHFELRLNDEPVDPATYLAAGEKLLAVLRD